MRRPRRRLAAAFTALALASTVTGPPSLAQEAAGAADESAGTPVRVMILGTYHFAGSETDVVRPDVADITSPEKQAEVRAVVDSLARFRATTVAIEATPEHAPRFDSLYRAYRAGEHEMAPNERQQLGFRLAARSDLETVHPIDYRGEFPWNRTMAWAREHRPEFVEWAEAWTSRAKAVSDSLQEHATVTEILRRNNDPAGIAEHHAPYMRIAEVGADSVYVGPDLVAKWYRRNVHIFHHLTRIAGPGDRILVIFGAGHAAILRHLVRSHPGMELVDPLEYL